MNLREAKKITVAILERWRFLSSRKMEPRYLVVQNRRDRAPEVKFIFKNHAHAKRYAEAQINPRHYGIITLGGP